jgi:CRISPR/Cas system-associated exonuclease Cas4 (RecB family)
LKEVDVEVENEVEVEIEIEVEKIINQKAIVLDYKTGLPNKKYTKQVTEYALALKEIGYIEVEAYLFYTATKKLERII